MAEGTEFAADIIEIGDKIANLTVAKAQIVADYLEQKYKIKPAGGGGRVLFLADGEGNLLHLVERPGGFDPGSRNL